MSATRRASPASSIVQQPRALSRSVAADWLSARCTPTTSCPASSIRAAATAESTPPLIAATTRIRSSSPRTRRPGRGGRARAAAGSAARNASTSASVEVWPRVTRSAPRACVLGHTHGQQDVAGLRHARLAGRAGGALDAGGVQEVEQGVAVAAGDQQVRVAGQAVQAVALAPVARDGDLGLEAIALRTSRSRSAASRAASASRRPTLWLDGHREAADGGGVEGAAAQLRAPGRRRGSAARGRRRAGPAGRRCRAGRRSCGR